MAANHRNAERWGVVDRRGMGVLTGLRIAAYLDRPTTWRGKLRRSGPHGFNTVEGLVGMEGGRGHHVDKPCG